jgi:hypothetical protein
MPQGPATMDRLLWSGLVAALLYAATVAVGGLVLSGYDPWNEPISAMTAVGRTDSGWIAASFVIYNIGVAVYAAAALLRKGVRTGWQVVFALLFGTAIAGLLMGPFAMDAPGSAMTVVGMVHIGLAAFTSLATIAIVAMSAALWRGEGEQGLSWIALACLGLIVPFGLLAALATANAWPLSGIYERLTIGGFEIWLGVGSVAFARRPGRLGSTGRRAAKRI